MNKTRFIKNKKGQGLIEYLIIVAIVAVGSIAVIKVVGANIDVQFANVAKALGGDSGKVAAKEVTEGMYKKRDFGNFFEDAVNDKSSNKSKGK
ncbi:Flp family type IVb pilin [Bdellovibrio sp. HCB185ZH]|uniref:Flp family type IVb pilin n=1 Tax=Bdellovibrio sp. HCB185ZH TaxID=3394235 RepID=UPI0039A64317